MAEKNLSVPYKSQWDPDANQTKNDCGPTSIAMALAFMGITTTTDEVFRRTGAGQGFITIQQLLTAISSYSYIPHVEVGISFDRIKQLIDQNIPVIALVHYGDLSSRQDKGFAGPHLFLVVGYRDDTVFVNDPDFFAQFRQDGDHHAYPIGEFISAWANATQDGNLANQIIWIEPHTQQQPTVVTPDLAACQQQVADEIKKKNDTWQELQQVKVQLDTANKQVKDYATERDGFTTQITSLQGFQKSLSDLLKVDNQPASISGAIAQLIATEDRARQIEKTVGDTNQNNDDLKRQLSDVTGKLDDMQKQYQIIADQLQQAQDQETKTEAELSKYQQGEILYPLFQLFGYYIAIMKKS